MTEADMRKANHRLNEGKAEYLILIFCGKLKFQKRVILFEQMNTGFSEKPKKCRIQK